MPTDTETSRPIRRHVAKQGRWKGRTMRHLTLRVPEETYRELKLTAAVTEADQVGLVVAALHAYLPQERERYEQSLRANGQAKAGR